MSVSDDLVLIRRGLETAGRILEKYTSGRVESRKKEGGSPVTEADLEVDAALRELLPRDGDGWLSEETADRTDRLRMSRVWVVDPLDGTKEFITGIPEWCVSIGLVQDGEAVAGGIYNPAARQMVIGGLGEGVLLNGASAKTSGAERLEGTRVLASRSEVERGEWERFAEASFSIVPMGSVAYKLSLVGAGLADATWTLVPKNEWDVAAGAAIVRAAGGEVRTLDWAPPRFNRERVKLTGLVACGPRLAEPIRRLLGLGGSPAKA